MSAVANELGGFCKGTRQEKGAVPVFHMYMMDVGA